jgi:hypothetical protein
MLGDFGEQSFGRSAGTDLDAHMLGGFENFSLKEQVVDKCYDLRHAVYLTFRGTMRGDGQQATLVAGFFFDANTFVCDGTRAALHAVVHTE